MLEYPHITASDPLGQNRQIIDFLWQTVERLNYELSLLSEVNQQSTEAVVESKPIIPLSKVDSNSTSTAFTAKVNGIDRLEDGVCAFIKNGVVTSASGFTLNINALGAKPVYLNTGSQASTEFNSAYTALFVYNSTRVQGGCWDMYS